jgi:hypothetical protein
MSAMPDSTFADPKDHLIAGLQRQLAERTAERDEALAERDEALAQQAATAEVLQVINASPGNLAPVFEAILEKAIKLCGATLGFLWAYSGDAFHLVAQSGAPAAFLEARQGPQRPSPGTIMGRMARGEDLLTRGSKT